ncbi:MAG TPA: DUF2585 family protein [Kiritimatiellia bacterium]|nr:DUF2585 family protein [Kiritimatiellia bacterium]
MNRDAVIRKIAPWLAVVAILIVMVLQLHRQGRVVWCACGQYFPWAGDIWSSHNSQHFFDPYSFTHVLHGMIFCGLLVWLFPRLSVAWSLSLAVLIEAGWEVLENSTFIIQRYREATIGLGYEGDSIANSLADILCCAFGFVLARRLGLWRSVLVFVVVELVLLFWVRDNLTLNILMLTFPIKAVKTWQMGP